jgi:hypothetical protein
MKARGLANMGRGRIGGSTSRSLLNLDQSEASDVVHRRSATRVTAEPQRAGCAPAHRADAALGLSPPGGCFRPLSSPIQRRSDLTGCCAVVVCDDPLSRQHSVQAAVYRSMQAADFRNPTVFAQVERVSMRASAGCFRPGMPLPFAPKAISKRVETADERSRVVVWWGHPTLVLILRCGEAASKEGSSGPRDP